MMLAARVVLTLECALFGFLGVGMILPMRESSVEGLVLIAVALIAGICTALLGPGRRWAWLTAVVLQTAMAAAFGWFTYAAITTPAREGLLAFAGMVVGVPLTLVALAGLACLVFPSVVSSAWRQPSYPS